MKEEIHDINVRRVLQRDGVDKIILGDFENLPTIGLNDIKKEMGDGSWAVRIVYNDMFGGVLIKQNPEEGNRLHHHPYADEFWIILEGEWEWYIDGIGTRRIGLHDMVLVKKGIQHKIKCIGNKHGIRLAITMPDVDHTYNEDDF